MEPQQKSNSALVGSIIIIIILVIGGIFFFRSNIRAPYKERPATIPIQPGESSANLDAAVNNIDINNVDQGL